MSLVVHQPFHVNGAMKRRGDVLTSVEQSIVEADSELLARCGRNPAIPTPDVEAAPVPEVRAIVRAAIIERPVE